MNNIHQSMLQYHENMHEYNENMRRYLQYLYENAPNGQSASTTPTTSRNILIRLIQNILRNRNNIAEEDRAAIPTDIQIQNATETFVYNENEYYNTTSCPISFDAFRTGDEICRIKYCSHLFKKNELLTWFQVNAGCPVCRYDIRNYVESEEEEGGGGYTTPIIRNNLSQRIRTIWNNELYNDYEYYTVNLPIYVDTSGNYTT